MTTITRAKINESQEIRRIEDKIWKEKNVTSKYDIANFVRFGYVFVAKEKGKIVGAIIAMRTKDDKIYVNDWFVKENHRGKGTGTMLYNALIKEAKGRKIIVFVMPDNKVSLKAHSKLGFKVVKKVDAYNLGKTRILLERG